jgi:hypothetical protein
MGAILKRNARLRILRYSPLQLVKGEAADWREGLVADLGGDAALSRQQLELVDITARTKVLIDHLDKKVLALADLDTEQAQKLLQQRAVEIGTFHRCLRMLGVKKLKAPKGSKLAEFMKAMESKPSS